MKTKHLVPTLIFRVLVPFPLGSLTAMAQPSSIPNTSIPAPCQWTASGQLALNALPTPGSQDREGYSLTLLQPEKDGLHFSRTESLSVPSKHRGRLTSHFIVDGDTLRWQTALPHEDTKIARHVVFAKPLKQGDWVQVAELERPKADGPIRLIRLENGNYLGVAAAPIQWTEDRKEQSPFAVLSVDSKDRLRWSSTIDPEVKISSIRQMGFNGKDPLIVLEHHVLLLSRCWGQYWVFSRENGNLKRCDRLMSGITEAHLAKGACINMVHAAHPTSTGSILVATRDESYITEFQPQLLKDNAAYSGSIPSHLSEKEADEELEKRAKLARIRLQEREMFNSVVHWYEWDTTDLRFRKRATPPVGGVSVLASYAERREASEWIPAASGDRVVNLSKMQREAPVPQADPQAKPGRKPAPLTR